MTQYTHITNLISELLYKHDCVIVPNFGGFVSRHYSAGFNKGNNLLFPPAKHIIFNKNLIHNDGLLVTALMEKDAILFEEAAKRIEDYRLYIQSLLGVKKRFELPAIGLLYMDSENSLRFEAKADMNFLFDSFGFEPVMANELAIEPQQPVARPVFENRMAVAGQTSPKQKKSYAKMAALTVGIPAALAFLIFAAYSKPMQPIMQSSVNPFYTPGKTYMPNRVHSHTTYIIEDVAEPVLLADANGYAAFTLKGSRTVIIANTNDTVIKADKTMVHSLKPANVKPLPAGKFQVVLGCFGRKENAVKLINELSRNKLNAGVSGVNSKGLYVVSCGSFNDKKEAAALLEVIKANYPKAWIMEQ